MYLICWGAAVISDIVHGADDVENHPFYRAKSITYVQGEDYPTNPERVHVTAELTFAGVYGLGGDKHYGTRILYTDSGVPDRFNDPVWLTDLASRPDSVWMGDRKTFVTWGWGDQLNAQNISDIVSGQ